MSYDTTQFEKDLNVLGVTLTKEQIDQFLKYYELWFLRKVLHHFLQRFLQLPMLLDMEK